MAHTEAIIPIKKRILQTCVRLFLVQGYQKTTMLQILEGSQVSNSSFQNIFRAKDGVLAELVDFMFAYQFSAARETTAKLPPVYVYAAETAIQLTLTELNENLREIYGVAYTKPLILDSIVQQTAQELQTIFSPYLPGLTHTDFYHLDIGTSGVMRSYMLHPVTRISPWRRSSGTSCPSICGPTTYPRRRWRRPSPLWRAWTSARLPSRSWKSF